MIWVDLIYNLALLVALSVVSGFVEARWKRTSRLGPVLQGVVFGGAAVIGMLRPFVHSPGLIFDGRSVMISLGALFFGPWTAAVSGTMTVALRVIQGGPGAVMGVLVISASAGIGTVYYLRRPQCSAEVSAATLLQFGVLVHLAMLAMTVVLPHDMILPVLRRIGWPVMLTYPLATVLVGKILSDQAGRAHFLGALRESEAKFRSYIEKAPVAVLVADMEGNLVDCNPAAVSLTGFDAPVLRNMRVSDLHLEEDRHLMVAALRTLVRAGQAETELRLRTRDERIIWVSLKVSRIADDRALGYCQDITERKLALERIHQQAALLDATADGVYVCSLDNRLTYWNLGAEKLYGWTAADVLGRKISDLDKANAPAIESAHAEVVAKGNWAGELRRRTEGGKEVVVFFRGSLLRAESGAPQAVLAIHTDVTERKQLEANLLRAQRLEAIGALASGIAHDLNNILSPILISTNLLRAEVRDPESRELIDTMETSARRGSEIIRQLLTFARGRPNVRICIPVRHLFEELRRLIQETFPRNLRVRVRTPSDLWSVQGDATQIHQALMNLCVNARDAMPNGGELSLLAANVPLDETAATALPEGKPGSYVRISVGDTGEGIPADQMNRIFEPFFTTKELGKGTGLGLPTVLGIVRGHEGFVQVASQVGVGTRFDLYLPATAQLVADVREEPVLQATGAGELLLVVDDEASLRQALIRMFERSGYRVLGAAEGNEALALFTLHRGAIRAVITDAMMPGMNGPALVRAIRSLDPRLPVLGMTGLGEEAEGRELRSLGLPAVLNKPFEASALLAALRQALDLTAASPVPP